jgi:hypothetical protein
MKKQKEEEKIVGNLGKPAAVTPDELQRIKRLISSVNRLHSSIGSLEAQKHHQLHLLDEANIEMQQLQTELIATYGTNDISIQDGVINYPKENGEVNS